MSMLYLVCSVLVWIRSDQDWMRPIARLSVILRCCFPWSSEVPVLQECSSRGCCWLSHPAQWSARVGQDAAVFLPLHGRWVARCLNLCKVLWVGRDVQSGRVRVMVWAWKNKKKIILKTFFKDQSKCLNCSRHFQTNVDVQHSLRLGLKIRLTVSHPCEPP